MWYNVFVKILSYFLFSTLLLLTTCRGKAGKYILLERNNIETKSCVTLYLSKKMRIMKLELDRAFRLQSWVCLFKWRSNLTEFHSERC